MSVRIVLSGGGSAEDTVEHHRVFASWVGHGGRIIYIPGGAFPPPASLAWFNRTIREFGSFQIHMWDLLSKHKPPAFISDIDGIYVGGGNTFTLLKAIRMGGYDKLLIDAIVNGVAYCGGSAGAIIAGKDIMSCSFIDANDVGLENTQGFDLANGYSICCHYETSHDPLIWQFMNEFESDVVALTERDAVAVVDRELFSIGPDDAHIITQNGSASSIGHRLTSVSSGRMGGLDGGNGS